MDKEYIKDLEDEVVDSEKSVKDAEESVKVEQAWLNKMKLRLAEDIIRLHNAKK